MFTRATYNIIDRTYHGGGAKFDCFLFSFFFFTLLKTPRCILDRSRPGSRRCAVLVASEEDLRTKNSWKPTKPCLVVDLMHCCEATRRRGNIRMGRYSGCVTDRGPRPDPGSSQSSRAGFAASLAGLRSCLREAACAISGTRCISETRLEAAPPRLVFARGIW